MNALRVSFREMAHDIAYERLVEKVDNGAKWKAVIEYMVERRCITDYRGDWLKKLCKNEAIKGTRVFDGTKYSYIMVDGVIVAHYEEDQDTLKVEYKGVEPFYRDLGHEGKLF